MITPKVNDEIVLEEKIINYIKSKGKLRGVLLFRLEKNFCSRDSKVRIKKNELITCLFSMMRARKIEIIMTEPFDIQWKIEPLNDLEYLKNQRYLIRSFINIKGLEQESIKENQYFFDSRSLDFNSGEFLEERIKELKSILKKAPSTKYKVIIFYPKNSIPLNIYEPFEGEFNRNFTNFKAPSDLIEQNYKFEIPLEQQKIDLAVIKSYRSNYMCFYITLIESIQKSIQGLQEQIIECQEDRNKLMDFITKFTYYCEMYVNSDWVDIQKGNPYKWETFFKFFKIPMKILKLKYNSIKFHGRTFETWSNFKFCIYIDREEKELISKLKDLGYQEFEEENLKRKISIGLDLESFVPCPAIEYLYFIFKYICYYNLFLLFSHSFSYIKKTIPGVKFSERDKHLYKIIELIMKPLFNVNSQKLTNRIVFKYYTLNPEELEIIYNTLVVNKIRKIEKSLFNYFLLRTMKK